MGKETRKIDVRQSRPFEDQHGNIIVRKAHEREIEAKAELSKEMEDSIKYGKAKRIINEKEEFIPIKLSRLEKEDFKDYRHLETIIKELEKPKWEQDEFNLHYAMKQFILFIRDKTKGRFSEQYRQWELIQDLQWNWEDLHDAMKEDYGPKEDYNPDEAFENWLDYEASDLDTLMLFERIRDALHHSGYFLEHIYPDAPKDFFDKLSGIEYS